MFSLFKEKRMYREDVSDDLVLVSGKGLGRRLRVGLLSPGRHTIR